MTLLLLFSCGSEESLSVYDTEPNASITQPADGAEYDEGTVVTLEGLVDDAQDTNDKLEVTWSSDIAGLLAEGQGVDADGYTSFSTGNLEPGNHTITLQVVDSAANAGQATITLTINELDDAPVVTIVRPQYGEDPIDEGEAYSFVAEITDAHDGPDALTLDITTDNPASGTEVCSGLVPDSNNQASCNAVLAASGTHLLTFTGTDSEGFSSSATVYFSVTGSEDIDDDGDGFSENQGDCDDAALYSHPGGTELEDGADNDCDDTIDETTDAYDDGGDGYSENEGDCDDDSSQLSPDATEYCDSIDNNCNDQVDEEGATGCDDYWPDEDGDGYGDETRSSRCYCDPTEEYTVTNDDDCYDGNSLANPAQSAYYETHRGDYSYDYNCDGSESKETEQAFSCNYDILSCNDTAGWSSSGGPSCGSSATWYSGCEFELDFDDYCTYTSTSTATQSCR